MTPSWSRNRRCSSMGDLTKEQSVRDTENMAALRDLATKAVAKAAAADLNVGGYRGYKPEDIDPDSIPLSIDLIQFVLWLRHNSDFFSGPNPVSYTHLRAHETSHDLVCRL